MSRRKKLEKFADLLSFSNVYEGADMSSEEVQHSMARYLTIKGTWQTEAFDHNQPLVVELACGRGEYSVAMAGRHPEFNHIGVDIKGARIWQGARKALDLDLLNVVFLRTRIERLDCYFVQGEIDEIWITFPDPFHAKENRRLTAPSFLSMYYGLLSPFGKIHLKTDDPDLYQYSVDTAHADTRYETIYTHDDIYGQDLYHPDLDIKTYYETKHLADNKTIKYLLLAKKG